MGLLKRQTLKAKPVEEAVEPKHGYVPIDFADIDKAIEAKLTSAEFRVWLYTMKFDRYGDEGKWKDVPSPTQMGVRLGMDRRTVEKAMERLRDLGLLDMRVKSWQIINSTAARANATGRTMKLAKEEVKTSKPSQVKVGYLAQKTVYLPKYGSDSPDWANLPKDGLNNSETAISPKSSSETQSQQASHVSLDYLDYLDYIDSLSEGEREKFLKFAEGEAAKLPQPPVLVGRWVEKNYKELWVKFKASASGSASLKDWENHLRREEWLDKIRTLGFGSFIYESGDRDEERYQFYKWADGQNLIWGQES